MKYLINCLFCSLSFVLFSQKIIELPLTVHSGYGPFDNELSGLTFFYTSEKNNPWEKTYLKVTHAPSDWTNLTFGDIETNIYQSVYQNYLAGNITKELFAELYQSWFKGIDTLELSGEPLKTKIAFVIGKDSKGETRMMIDAGNNLDFSDDESFVPFPISQGDAINDSVGGLSSSIYVSYERISDGKKQTVKTPLFIAYMSEFNMYLFNFPEYLTTDFNGENIAVCSSGFGDLSYQLSGIILLTDSMMTERKINPRQLIMKNEFIELNGEFYKNKGVKPDRNVLILEQLELPKNELNSAQIGFKSPPFEGTDFKTNAPISSQQLKGKYLLVDFWAVWCAPCREEIPSLKELYAKTDREQFEIIGIVGESDPKLLKELIKKKAIDWPQMLSSDANKIIETYGVHGYPASFLINPEGIIIAKDLRGEELEEKILGLLNQPK